jgi:hypothetical protein
MRCSLARSGSAGPWGAAIALGFPKSPPAEEEEIGECDHDDRDEQERCHVERRADY